MYWLRWHYNVKDIAGAPYKIKKKSKQKRQNRRQSVVAGRQQEQGAKSKLKEQGANWARANWLPVSD